VTAYSITLADAEPKKYRREYIYRRDHSWDQNDGVVRLQAPRLDRIPNLEFSTVRVQLPGLRDCTEQPFPLCLNARKGDLRKRQRNVVVFEEDREMTRYARLYEYESQNNAHWRRKSELETGGSHVTKIPT
jgi:hypothetical protein